MTNGWFALVLNNRVQLRQLVPDLQNLLKLMVIFDDNNVTFGDGRNGTTRLRRVRRVNSGRQATAAFTKGTLYYRRRLA